MPDPFEVTAAISAGGVVSLPAGDFAISRSLIPPMAAGLVLRGVSARHTRLRFVGDAGPLLKLQGTPERNFNTFDISNLTLDGGGKAVTGLALDHCSQGRLDRVVFTGFAAGAIDARVWWDSLVLGCDVVDSGDATLQIPAVWLHNGSVKGDNCNNISWVGGRFESNRWVSLRIGGPVLDPAGVVVTKPLARSRVCRFETVKFHSTAVPLPYDHVWLESCDDCSISGNLTNCGGTAIVQRDCNDHDLQKAHIGNFRGSGVEIHNCPRWSVDGVTWSTVGGPSNHKLVVDGAVQKVA